MDVPATTTPAMPPAMPGPMMPGPQTSSPNTDAAGRILTKIIEAAKKDRETWLKLGDDINRYTTGEDYSFIYQNMAGFDGEDVFRARVNKAAEFQRVMGSYLYQENPDATVNSEPWATLWAQRRHAIEEQYADYAARVGRYGVQMRRTVDHALVYGRGPQWTGYNTKRKIVESVSDIAANMLLDPDAQVEEEINWQGRKRIKQRWKVISQYPQSRSIIEHLPVYAQPKTAALGKRDPASELIEYFEVWTGVDIANYDSSMELVTGDGQAVNPFQKYCFADGKIIHQGDWEIPFFLIDEWPGAALDIIERTGGLYPHQPMEPGIGHLRAMNLLYTLFIYKYTLMSRTPFAFVNLNGQKIEDDQIFKIIHGEHMDSIRVTINGNETVKITDLMQRIDWGDPVPGFERIWGLLSQEFERSTSLTEVLATGQTPTQIRNAATANLIETRSRTQVDSMRETVLKFMERQYRKHLFAARFLEGPDDISKLFGPDAGKVWGELGPPQAVAQEQQVRATTAQQIGAQSQQMGAPMAPEQIEEMLGPPEFVAMDDWITEADRTIDAGSAKRIDADAQMQNMNVAINQLGPALVNLPGGGAYVAALAKEFSKLNRFSPEMQAAADQLLASIQQAQAMQMAPVTQGAPNPPAGPQTGPAGGEAPQQGQPHA